MTTPQDHQKVLIVDFGSQVTQLIARRLRESGVYCEVWPFNNAAEDRIRAFAPKGIIFSGGPASVTEGASPRAPDYAFASGLPIPSQLMLEKKVPYGIAIGIGAFLAYPTSPLMLAALGG